MGRAMKKLLAVAFLALSVANANAQSLMVSPSGGGGTPGGAASTVQYNNAGAFGGMSGTSWDDTNRSLTINGATVTASHPVLELSQTWNNAAVTFTGLSFNAVNTASNAASLLFNLQLNGATVFNVSRSGSIGLTTGAQLGFSTTGIVNWTDLFLTRSAAATLRLGLSDNAAPVAQSLVVQNVVAGTTNTAGANWTLKGSAGTGTGAGGSIIFQTAPADGSGSAQNAFVTAVTIDSPGTLRVKGFTVATLPAAGTAGRIAYVSDQLTACPALGGTFTGGGAVVCKAFDDGTNWTHQ
jgi:hypothetical protein